MFYIVINFISNRFCFSILVSKLPRRFLTVNKFVCLFAEGLVVLWSCMWTETNAVAFMT